MFAYLVKKIAGNFGNAATADQFIPEAKELLERTFQLLPDKNFLDCHVHIMGNGSNDTGCWAKPEMFSPAHFTDYFKTTLYLSSSGITDLKSADSQFTQRLKSQLDVLPLKGKFVLLAMDKVYSEDGIENLNDTKFYVPNDYILKLTKQHPHYYIPCISVHPYRKDAVAELEKYAALGVKLVKWLPNTMGMDPSHELCIPFYEKMKELKMVLLTHAGTETALEIKRFNDLGNPLLFRLPLDIGVKMIMAHCAGLGTGRDFDHNSEEKIPNHLLFLRLMKEDKYKEILYGDISAIAQINRMGDSLNTILGSTEIHDRLFNGSDYPLPALNAVISTLGLQLKGYITAKERKGLNDIYKKNPVLFDLVLKTCLKHPGSKTKFPASVFDVKKFEEFLIA